MNNTGPQKKRTVFDSFSDAFRGIWDCLRSERNMRIHAVTCVYVLFFASRLGLSRGEMACLILAIGTVTAAEAMNTAVEKLCDFTQKRQNQLIRVIKDMAAGAVLLCALAAALVGVVVLFRPELWAALWEICSQPSALALFLLSLAAALVFVFVGPARLGEKAQALFGKRKKG